VRNHTNLADLQGTVLEKKIVAFACIIDGANHSSRGKGAWVLNALNVKHWSEVVETGFIFDKKRKGPTKQDCVVGNK